MAALARHDLLMVIPLLLLALASAYQYWGLPDGIPGAFAGYGSALAEWDWMLLTGLATFTVGVQVARSVPARLDQTISRLVDRGVLALDANGRKALDQVLHARARTWAWRSGLIVAAAIA